MTGKYLLADEQSDIKKSAIVVSSVKYHSKENT